MILKGLSARGDTQLTLNTDVQIDIVMVVLIASLLPPKSGFRCDLDKSVSACRTTTYNVDEQR